MQRNQEMYFAAWMIGICNWNWYCLVIFAIKGLRCWRFVNGIYWWLADFTRNVPVASVSMSWRLHGWDMGQHGVCMDGIWGTMTSTWDEAWGSMTSAWIRYFVVSKHDRVSTFTIAMLNSALCYIGLCYNVTQQRYTSSRQTLNVQMGYCISNDIVTGPGFVREDIKRHKQRT